MNLFDFPSLNDFSGLLFSSDYSLGYFDILVDHDGEVQIKKSAENSNDALKKYKFYFSQINSKNNSGNMIFKNSGHLSHLLKKILYCWKNNLQGEINYIYSDLNAFKSKVTRSNVFSVYLNSDRNLHITQLNN